MRIPGFVLLWATKNNNLRKGLGFTAFAASRYDINSPALFRVWSLWARMDGMTEQRIKSFPVSWAELNRTSKALAWQLLELGPFKGLIAVTRGGLVPAAIVALEL